MNEDESSGKFWSFILHFVFVPAIWAFVGFGMGTAAYGVVALISMLITDNGGWYERWYPWVMLATTSIGLLGGFVLGALCWGHQCISKTGTKPTTPNHSVLTLWSVRKDFLLSTLRIDSFP